MDYILCKIAAVCILICYVQRCIKNPAWITIPVSLVVSVIPIALAMWASFYIVDYFETIGWLPN